MVCYCPFYIFIIHYYNTYLFLHRYIFNLFILIFTGTVDLVSSKDTADWLTASSDGSSIELDDDQRYRRGDPSDSSGSDDRSENAHGSSNQQQEVNDSVMEVSIPPKTPPVLINVTDTPSLVNISSDED